jgi:hypothetical protein
MKTTFFTNDEGQIFMDNGDGVIWGVPNDEANSDYQRYLRWLENPDAEENGTIS